MPIYMYAGQRVYVADKDASYFVKDENNTNLNLSERLAKYHAYEPKYLSCYAKAFVLVVTTPRYMYNTMRFKMALKSLFPRSEMYWNAMCVAINTAMQPGKKYNIPCPGEIMCVWKIWSAFIESILEPAKPDGIETFGIFFKKKTDFTDLRMDIKPIGINCKCPFNHAEDESLDGFDKIFIELRNSVTGAFLEYLQCCANGVDYIDLCLNKSLLNDAKINQDQCKDQIGGCVRSVLLSFVVANCGSFNDRNLVLNEKDIRPLGSQDRDPDIYVELQRQVIKIGSVVMFYTDIFKFPRRFAKLFEARDEV